MAHANDTIAFDPLDPHGSNHIKGHHGHTVVPWQIQLAVLTILLLLTGLTVGVAQAEGWAMSAMGVSIPHWVNIIGAMLIAVVKATLVCTFFMQLRYDKALNTIVFSSCLFCVFLFLFFSMLDLQSRGVINPEKSGQIVAGGTGYGLNQGPAEGVLDAGLGPRPTTGGAALTTFAYEKERLDPKYGSDEAMWNAYYHHQIEDGFHPHRHEKDATNYFALLGYDHANTAQSTPDRSRPRQGLTPGLFDATAPMHTPGLHGDHHDGHPAEPHADEPHTDEPHAPDAADPAPAPEGDGH